MINKVCATGSSFCNTNVMQIRSVYMYALVVAYDHWHSYLPLNMDPV